MNTIYPNISALSIENEILAQDPISEVNAYIEKGKWCCSMLPLPLLGCVAVGGTGFALWTGFGTAPLQAASIANIIFDGYAVASSVFSGGCYYYNLPNRSFEKNVEEQIGANAELEKVEGDIASSIDVFRQENERLKLTLKETEEKSGSLKNELDAKTTHLTELSNQLDTTLQQLNLVKDDFGKANSAIRDAKQLIINMQTLSKTMGENIKASSVAADLLKVNTNELKHENDGFNTENSALSDLLKNYSEIISDEHKQFSLLINTFEDLKKGSQSLKNESQNFSDNEKTLEKDLDQDIKNMAHMEKLKKELEEFNKEF